MTNNTPKPLSEMTRLERMAFFSAAKEDTVMPDGPIRRPAPRPRRTSVRHRSIR